MSMISFSNSKPDRHAPQRPSSGFVVGPDLAARFTRPGIWGVAVLFVLAAFLSGCAIGPRYERPKENPPEAFRGDTQTATNTNSFADLPWFQVFPDDNLQKLIRVALTNNYDLRVAVTRVEQARQIVIEARSGLFPQIGYTGEVGRGKNVSANQISPTGLTGTAAGGDVNASWDIDLWGRIRKLTESARAQYLATDEARHDITASLIAQLAQDYFQLLSLDRQLAVARDSTNSFGESLRIFAERLKGGVASQLETSSAEALLDAAAATIPDLERQIEIQENQISVLLGQNMSAIERTNSMLEKQVVPEVPAGLPSALLERRPDIREAEQQLRSANAQVGVAQTAFLPQLELTGLFGRVSPGLAVFSGGGANAWEVAAGLTGPIFQGGFLRAQYKQALAARQQYALQYQSTVLNALQEVSSALISGQKYEEERVRQAQAVEAYQKAVKIANERYKLGQSSYYEVLQEQQLLFPAENTLVQTQASQLISVIQLYRALGGGWQTNQTTTNQPAK
jgi:multidrug efflux system outer membrane protein